MSLRAERSNLKWQKAGFSTAPQLPFFSAQDVAARQFKIWGLIGKVLRIKYLEGMREDFGGGIEVNIDVTVSA
jgi:hypothetical protein